MDIFKCNLLSFHNVLKNNFHVLSRGNNIGTYCYEHFLRMPKDLVSKKPANNEDESNNQVYSNNHSSNNDRDKIMHAKCYLNEEIEYKTNNDYNHMNEDMNQIKRRKRIGISRYNAIFYQRIENVRNQFYHPETSYNKTAAVMLKTLQVTRQ